MARILFISFLILAALGLLWLNHTTTPINNNVNLPAATVPASKDPQTGFNNSSTWNVYIPPSGKFRVALPSLPQNASSKIVDKTTKNLKYFSTYVSPKDNTTAFMVNVVSFMVDEDVKDEQQTIVNAVQEMVDSNKENKLIELKEESFKNNKAYEFSVENNTLQMTGKAFIKNKQLYILTMITPLGEANTTEFNYFVNSFEPTE